MIKEYVKKPVKISALIWNGTNRQELLDFVGNPSTVKFNEHHPVAIIIALEGDMIASPGDYIIRGIRGEFYPCKPEIFVNSYDELIDTIA